VRCERGWCDLVRVDLATREVRVLRAGSVTRNYNRPRISRKTGEIVVAEQLGDRWRIARVSPFTGELRYADPEDGANRYDATFDVDGESIITTTERGGFVNIERIPASGSDPVPLTRVTGAAVAADVAPDGAVWFLNLQSSGYDLRRLQPDSVRIEGPLPLVVIGDTLSSVLPPRRRVASSVAVAAPSSTSARTESGYHIGPSRFRYVPTASAGYGGGSLGLAIERSDPVGRLGVQLLGVTATPALPTGGAVTITSRARRTVVGVTGWYSHEAPSRELAAALESGLDLARAGGALRLDRRRATDGGELTATLAALGELQRPAFVEQVVRRAVIGAFGATLRRVDEDVRYLVAVDALGEIGASDDARYSRQRGSLLFGTARGDRSLLTARLAYGTVGNGGGVDAARERYVVGGFRSPLIDPLYDARRVDAPAYPLGSAEGLTFASYRIGIPIDPIEAFYSGVTADFFQSQRRSYGVEFRERFPAIAALGTPEASLLAGLARAQDDPVRGKWRFYLSVAVRP
jgi:hypothetical protein